MTLLLLSAVLMLVVAACESDDNGTDDATDNGNETEVPADDQTEGETETVTPEGDESDDTASDDDESDDTGSEDEAEETEEPEATEPAEGTSGEDDEVAESGEDEEAEPGDEDSVDPEAEGTVDPEDMQPGPEEGIFLDLDFEEANDLTEFELKEPQEVPENVEFQMIMGRAAQDASEEERSEEAVTVTFAYTQPAGDETQQGLPVEFTQSTELDMSEGLPQEAEQEEITIGDREVTRVQLSAETGDEIIAYVWDEGDVHFSLAAILGPDLEESDLEDMVASIPVG